MTIENVRKSAKTFVVSCALIIAVFSIFLVSADAACCKKILGGYDSEYLGGCDYSPTEFCYGECIMRETANDESCADSSAGGVTCNFEKKIDKWWRDREGSCYGPILSGTTNCECGIGALVVDQGEIPGVQVDRMKLETPCGGNQVMIAVSVLLAVS